MVRRCIVLGCRTDQSNCGPLGLRLATIPLDKVDIWLRAVYREDLLADGRDHVARNYRICTRHFDKKYFMAENLFKLGRCLKQDAVPCLLPPLDPDWLKTEVGEEVENNTASEESTPTESTKTECSEDVHHKQEKNANSTSNKKSTSDLESTKNDSSKESFDPHSVSNEKSTSDLESIKNESSKESFDEEKTLKCRFCQKTFQHQSYLEIHIRTHTGERPYTCNVCFKGFCSSGSLKKHMHTHSVERPFKCDLCPAAFKRFTDLAGHKLNHSRKRPFECNLCEKFFVTSSALKVHQLAHVEESRYNCEVCRKFFPTSSRLKAHQRIHSGEKSYQCSYCLYNYGTSRSLSEHKKSGRCKKLPRLYKCLKCVFTTQDPSALIAHEKVHLDKSFCCSICPYKFNSAKGLKQHQREFHSVKDICKCSPSSLGTESNTKCPKCELKQLGVLPELSRVKEELGTDDDVKFIVPEILDSGEMEIKFAASDSNAPAFEFVSVNEEIFESENLSAEKEKIC